MDHCWVHPSELTPGVAYLMWHTLSKPCGSYLSPFFLHLSVLCLDHVLLSVSLAFAKCKVLFAGQSPLAYIAHNAASFSQPGEDHFRLVQIAMLALWILMSLGVICWMVITSLVFASLNSLYQCCNWQQ